MQFCSLCVQLVKGLNFEFCFWNPRKHVLAQNCILCIDNCSRMLAVACQKNQKKSEKWTSTKGMHKVMKSWRRIPWYDPDNFFCITLDVHDVMTSTNVGDDQLRGRALWGHIFLFFVEFCDRPYNTLALPACRVFICDTDTMFLIYYWNINGFNCPK